ncbi:MAG: chemotaxis protein CheA [Lentisphaerales bacterium]|nr:chemotaxis protein CheA [Lentisphaerales bacterium]
MSAENYKEDLDDGFMDGLLHEFIDSSLENLTAAQELSNLLKTGEYHTETIKEIFRMFHSLKGSSAIVGCMPVRNLAHSAESLLVKITEGQIQIDNDVADNIISTVDLLNSMIEDFGNSSKIGPELINRSNTLINQIDDILELDPTNRLQHMLFDEGLLNDLRESIGNDRREDSIKKLDRITAIIKNTVSPSESASFAENTSVFDELAEVEDDTDFPEPLYHKAIESLKAYLQSNGNRHIQSATSGLLEKIENIFEWSGPSEFLAEVIVDGHKDIQKLIKNTSENSKQSSKEAAMHKTMRVPETSLDEFIQLIGDLIIVREMIDDSRKRIDTQLTDVQLASEFKRHVDSFTITLSKLENSAMTIRKQSVKMLLNKLSRLAREIAAKVEKSINIDLIGSDTLIDKSLIELLEAPLIHIITNAVDHGLEKEDERASSGKESKGNITIKVVEDDESIFIDISDDGLGMNFEKLREKGKKIGVATDLSSNEELLKIIFLPGFSTASEVTDISGRGVGMDVVKKELEKAGGTINIQSEEGKGTTFTLKMPKSITTQIIQGFVLEVAGETFIIPVKNVRESFHPSKAKTVRMYDKFDCLETRGEVMPIVKISEYLYGEHIKSYEEIFIIVEEAGRNYALLADRVVGIQQVVLKELKGLKMLKQVFSGAALMGNGNVALVLDLANFLETSVESVNRS